MVDALDEATDCIQIAGKLLQPLVADTARGAYVYWSPRPGVGGELVHALGAGAVRYKLDEPPWLERADLVEFVRRRLLLADPPLIPPIAGRTSWPGCSPTQSRPAPTPCS